jgi:hypothetical protein
MFTPYLIQDTEVQDSDGQPHTLRIGYIIDNVGVNVGEFRPGQRLVQEVETVVEFMVSQIADGVIEKARAEAKNSVLVDNGDVIQGSPLGDYMAAKGLKLNSWFPRLPTA